MKSRTRISNKDVMVLVGCAVFLLANLGAIGSGGRRRAKEALCAANLKRWGIVLYEYAKDHNDRFAGVGCGGLIDWPERLKTYYISPGLLLCPEAGRTYAEGGINPHMAWEIDEGAVYRGSYVLNLCISDSIAEGFWRTPYVSGAANIPMLLDGQWKGMWPYPTDLPPANEADMWSPNQHEMRRACVSRHNGGVNGVFLDGSVRKVGLKKLWRLTWYRAWPGDYPLPVWPAWMANFEEP